MRKTMLLVMVVITATVTAKAQQKIVYDLNSADTAAHAVVIRQFNNVLREMPGAELEVVCHGNAVYMLVQAKATLEQAMKDLQKKGKVSFKVCANSMRRLGVDKSQLLPLAEVVPVAVLELAGKQKEGWSYIKAG